MKLVVWQFQAETRRLRSLGHIKNQGTYIHKVFVCSTVVERAEKDAPSAAGPCRADRLRCWRSRGPNKSDRQRFSPPQRSSARNRGSTASNIFVLLPKRLFDCHIFPCLQLLAAVYRPSLNSSPQMPEHLKIFRASAE